MEARTSSACTRMCRRAYRSLTTRPGGAWRSTSLPRWPRHRERRRADVLDALPDVAPRDEDGVRSRPSSVIIATMKRRTFLRHSAALAALPLVRGTLGGTLLPATPAAPMRVNGARLNGWLAKFDSIGRTPGGINR